MEGLIEGEEQRRTRKKAVQEERSETIMRWNKMKTFKTVNLFRHSKGERKIESTKENNKKTERKGVK